MHSNNDYLSWVSGFFQLLQGALNISYDQPKHKEFDISYIYTESGIH